MPIRRLRVLREGLFTGFLGASAVAVWFLIVDGIAGIPLFTPTALGSALFGVQTEAATQEPNLLLVAGYTAFHYTAFFVVGTLAALIIDFSRDNPAWLALFLIFFVMFEIGFYGLVAVFHETQLLQGLEWYQIAVGNLLASVLMGGYLLRTHPKLWMNLHDALGQ